MTGYTVLFIPSLPAAFVLALLEAIALAVHLQDMHMVGEPVQQSALGTGLQAACPGGP